MNKVNDYETLLKYANKDLKQFNVEINVLIVDEGEDDYSIEIRHLDDKGNVTSSDTFAQGLYEDDLSNSINEAWVHARCRAKEEIKKKYTLSNDAHLVAESIQEITLYAWPIIYGKDNPYDQDSIVVLKTIRDWGEEFEQWYRSHGDDWIFEHSYFDEIDAFADKKCKEYLKALGVEPGAIEIVDEQTGKVIASKPADEDRGHMEETIDVMIDIASLAEHRLADEVCDRDVERELTKEWGREFSKWYYCELTDDERLEKDYYESLCEFVDRKLTEYKEPKPKDYIVRIHRVEKYEADVLVSANSEEEAEKKVEEAWGDGRHDWLYEKMTDNINCESQTYNARQAYSTEEGYDFAL